MESLPEHVEHLVTSIANEKGISKPRFEISACSGTGDNYIGRLVRVVVKDDDNEKMELALVVKLPPINKKRRELFRVDVFFRNEAHVYQSILPAFADCYKQKGLLEADSTFPCTAKVYTCDISNDEGDVIILEDMRQRGFIMGNRKVGIDESHCRLVLRELARLHAASLYLQNRDPELHNKLCQRLTENVFGPRKEGDDERMKVFNDRCRSLIERRFPEGTEGRSKFEAFADDFANIMRNFISKDSKLLTITHGDTWTNNFLFKYDKETSKPVDVCLLDFQITRLASPVLDIVYLLFTSTSKALRDAHYDDLIKYYHKSLVGFLSDLGVNADEVAPWELFEQELKTFGAYGWGMAMLLIPLLLADKSDIYNPNDEPVNGKDGELLLLKNSRNDPAFEDKMSDALEDVIRLGYL